MTVAIIDYGSGNLRSAEKAFQRMAQEVDAGEVRVTSDPDVIRTADRVVLPGDGAFPACRQALFDHRGVFGILVILARFTLILCRQFLGCLDGGVDGVEWEVEEERFLLIAGLDPIADIVRQADGEMLALGAVGEIGVTIR